MANTFVYGPHKECNVVLSEAEKTIIAESPAPIHVFWNILSKFKDVTLWPENRKYPSDTGRTFSAVFVTYQSPQAPLLALGAPGDTWVTSDGIYVKEKDGTWMTWNIRVIFRCPYDENHRLKWARGGHFKYFTLASINTERSRWTKGGQSFNFPEQLKAYSPEVTAVLQKGYDDILTEDCVILLNAHCNLLRNPSTAVTNDDEDAALLVSNLDLDHQPSAAPNSEVPVADETGEVPFSKPKAAVLIKEKYRTPLDHRKSGGYVQCYNSMKVFLPPTKRGPRQKKSSRTTVCEWILSGRDATAPLNEDENSSPVAVLKSPSTQDSNSLWVECEDKIRDILAHGRLALITGATSSGPRPEWSEQYLSRVTGHQGDGSVLQWQSALKDEEHEAKGLAPETVKGTLSDLMAAEMNPEDSVNCLDVPLIGGELPPMIRAISACTRALCSTATVTFQHSSAQPKAGLLSSPEAVQPQTSEHTGVRKPGKRRAPVGGGASKRVRTMVPGDQDNPRVQSNAPGSSRSSAGAPRRIKRGTEAIITEALILANSYGGMHSIEWDAMRSISWVLISSSGAATDTHHDAAGYCTFLVSDLGAKFWGLAISNESPKSLMEAMKDYYRMATATAAQLRKLAKPVLIFLDKKKILVQPPSTLHAVYTPERSVFKGGHFYTLETMHLTEVSRACAVHSGQCGTNASHPGSTRLLGRIALSLVFNWQKSILRKPFISLARMLIWAHLYSPGDTDPQEQKPFEPNQESKAELAAAQAVVTAILEHNDIWPDEIEPKPFGEFEWISKMGEGSDWEDWREPGKIRLTIPDMRQYFEVFGYRQS